MKSLMTSLISVGALVVPCVLAHAQFTFTTNNGALTITRYSGNEAMLVIPEATNGYPITGIGAAAFLRRSSVTGILLPDSIVTIGDLAFASCSGLATINFPASLASIGEYAFSGCRSLTAVALPQSVTNIGYLAFAAGCTSLERITVDGLNPYYCDLDGVLFNRSQTILIQCPARRSGSYLVTNTVTSIGDAAFSGSALQSIVIPPGATDLGIGAFGSAALTSISIPHTVTNIGIQAFHGCSSLQSVSIPDGVASIGWETFFGCTGLTNLQIGTGVTSIGESAFYGCSSLTQVAIPDSVTNVDAQAFVDCSGLRTVYVGKGVTSIGTSAFVRCTDLSGIYFKGDAPSVGSWVFGEASVIVYYLPQTAGWGPNLGGWPTRLWNPTVQTSAPDFGLSANRFGFTVTGTASIPIVIDASANLENSPWTSLQSCSLTNGSIYFSDADWTNYPTRLYRIRSP